MANTSRPQPTLATLGPSPALLGLCDPSGFTEAVLAAQRLQYQGLLAWQRSLEAMQKEIWDQWVSHWAGGVPIDA